MWYDEPETVEAAVFGPQTASSATCPLHEMTGLAADAVNVSVIFVELSPAYEPVVKYWDTLVKAPFQMVNEPAICVTVTLPSAGIGAVDDVARMQPATPAHG